MIQTGGKDFITLQDSFYVNGKKVLAAYANNALVYPRKGSDLVKMYGELDRHYIKTFPEIEIPSDRGIYTRRGFYPSRFGIPSYSFSYNVNIKFAIVFQMRSGMSETIGKNSVVGYPPMSNSSSLVPQYNKVFNRFSVDDPLLEGAPWLYDDDKLYVYCNNPDYLDDVLYSGIYVSDSADVYWRSYELIFKVNIDAFTVVPRFQIFHNLGSTNPADPYMLDEYVAVNSNLNDVCEINGLYKYDNNSDTPGNAKQLGNTIFYADVVKVVKSSDTSNVGNIPNMLRIATGANDYLEVPYTRSRYDSKNETTTQKSIMAKVKTNALAVAPMTKVLYLGSSLDAPEWAKHVYESDVE